MEIDSGFQVRKATYDDIDAIAHITSAAFKSYAKMVGISNIAALEETKEDIKNDIDTKRVIIAFLDGKAVGTARIAINEEEKTAYLSRFGVDPEIQNNGIGKSIMNLIDKYLMHKGIKRLSLHTGAKLTSLIRFYYGRGFYVDSTTKDRGYIRALLHKDYE